MGIIRWTAKGMKLAGDILDSDDVEKWVISKGQALVERKLTGLPVKLIAGQYRAKRQVRADILGEVNGNEILRSAIETNLAALPSLIEKTAREVGGTGPSAACERKSNFVLTLCPRELVVKRYTKYVVDSLKDSALLLKYEQLPEQFLAKSARLSEESYFAERSRPDIGPRCRVVGTEPDFEWQLGETNGHYYIGYLYSGGDDLNVKAKAKEFDAFVTSARPKLDGMLAKLNAASMASFLEQMRRIL